MTECKTKRFEFHALSNREVIAHFDGGDISSDAGGLLLREVEQLTHTQCSSRSSPMIMEQLSAV